MTPKIWASSEAIRAISHQFAQRQTAIRWLQWLHRKLSIDPAETEAETNGFGFREMRQVTGGSSLR